MADRDPSRRRLRSTLERLLERGIFMSRWLLAPFYLALVLGLVLLAVKFLQELFHFLPTTFSASGNDVILAVLTLVDLVLVANLVLMVIFSGYENFVSKIDVEDHPDRPEWMGKLDAGGLKLKLIASIVAISSIALLKAFMNADKVSDRDLGWMVGLHLMFVVSGLILAITDKISSKR
ncbi:MAG: TIGR00645 family protein [Alphaproteobacteria bacterium]